MSTPPDNGPQFQIWRMDGESIEPAPDALPADLVARLRAEHERQNPPAPTRDKAADEPAALAPCPFCGSEARMLKYYGDKGRYVACTNTECDVETNWLPTAEGAARLWNTRTPPAVQEHALEAVEELATLKQAVQALFAALDGTEPNYRGCQAAEEALRNLVS